MASFNDSTSDANASSTNNNHTTSDQNSINDDARQLANRHLQDRVRNQGSYIQALEAQLRDNGVPLPLPADIPIDGLPVELQNQIGRATFREKEVIDCNFLNRYLSLSAPPTALTLTERSRARFLPEFLASNTFNIQALTRFEPEIEAFVKKHSASKEWRTHIRSLNIFIPWAYISDDGHLGKTDFGINAKFIKTLPNLETVELEILFADDEQHVPGDSKSYHGLTKFEKYSELETAIGEAEKLKELRILPREICELAVDADKVCDDNRERIEEVVDVIVKRMKDLGSKAEMVVDWDRDCGERIIGEFKCNKRLCICWQGY